MSFIVSLEVDDRRIELGASSLERALEIVAALEKMGAVDAVVTEVGKRPGPARSD